MLKEAGDDPRLPLPAAQLPAQLVAQLTRGPGTPPARSVRLDIKVARAPPG